jgi:hypothetical protein
MALRSPFHQGWPRLVWELLLLLLLQVQVQAQAQGQAQGLLQAQQRWIRVRRCQT